MSVERGRRGDQKRRVRRRGTEPEPWNDPDDLRAFEAHLKDGLKDGLEDHLRGYAFRPTEGWEPLPGGEPPEPTDPRLPEG